MNDGIRAELEQQGGDGVGLRRILDAVVDGVEVESDDAWRMGQAHEGSRGAGVTTAETGPCSGATTSTGT